MKRLFSMLTALLLAVPAFGGDSLLPKKQGQEFLPVDQAFELQPLERRDGKLIVAWRIAKDYYLYRDRLKFSRADKTPVAATLPEGHPHNDAYFGEVEIYRDHLRAELPDPGAGPVRLTVAYQGCADRGLCYPIQTRTLELDR